jgi:hypothetical protein
MTRPANPSLNAIALAAAAAAACLSLPVAAQGSDELLKELKALRERVELLERQVKAQPAAPKPGEWGMTPEQARELNRIAVKTEALQDNFTDQGYKGLKISGQIDPTYIINRRQNDRTFVFLNNGDARYTYDNSYFGMAVIDFEKETESGARWKLTLAPERGTGAVANSRSIVHEASVSLPLSDLQTRLWLGQIPDWTGYEITLPAGNKLITHNLLFDFTMPTNYTGAVLDITRGKWWSRVGLANFNSARQSPGNNTPALIYRVDYSKGEFSGFGFSGVHGKIPNFAADGVYNDPATGDETQFPSAGKSTMANLFEVDAFFTRGDWSLFGQVSVGQQKGAAIFNSDGVLRNAKWWGLSSTAAYKLTPRLEGVLRADYINNKSNGGGLLGYSGDDKINGIGRGLVPNGDGEYVDFAKGESIGSNRWALTLGMNYLFDESTIFKFELRQDGASQPVFYDTKSSRYYKSNTLLGASVVVSF